MSFLTTFFPSTQIPFPDGSSYYHGDMDPSGRINKRAGTSRMTMYIVWEPCLTWSSKERHSWFKGVADRPARQEK
jgi:hypothetical protein